MTKKAVAVKNLDETLWETQWNRRQTPRMLTISYRTLLYEIKQASVPPKRIGVNREKLN